MAGWDIRIDTDDDGSFADEAAIAGYLVNLTEELNGHETARIRIANTAANRTIVGANHDVRIQFNNVTIFIGRLTGADYSQEWLDCKVKNKVYQTMKYTTHHADYTTSTASTVMAAIAASAGVSWAISHGVGGNNISANFDYAQCYDAGIFLADSVTMDHWVHYPPGSVVGVFRIGTRGLNKGAVSNIAVSRRGVDRGQQRDQVRVRGTDTDGNAIYGTSGGGSQVAVYTERRSSDQTTLDGIADKYLADLNKDSVAVNVVVPISDGYNLYPGDTVTVVNTELNLNGAYKIWKTVKRVGDVSLSLDTPDITQARINNNLGQLENIGIYPISAKQIPLGQQGWGSNIEFLVGENDSSNVHNAFHWHKKDAAATDADIKFADGTAGTIDFDEATALGAAASYLYYIDVTENDPPNNLTLTQAASYDDLDAPNIIPLVKVRTPAAGSTTESIEIFPLFNAIEGDPVVGTSFLSQNVIVTPDFRTAWNTGVAGGAAGVRVGPGGVIGYSGGVQKTFELATGTGIVTVLGDGKFALSKADGTGVATIDMTVEGGRDVVKLLTVGGTKDIVLESGGYSIRLMGTGDIDIEGNAVMEFESGSRLLLPMFAGDPGAPRNGEVWIDTTV